MVQSVESWQGSLYGEAYLWSCQISVAPTDDPVTQLDVNNGSGNATLLDRMTLLIGSTPGAWDRGIFALRTDQNVTAATATLDVAPSSEMKELAVGNYCTILDEIRLTARFPRITEAAGVLSWYKDWSITYASLGADAATRRQASLPAVPIMGPHCVKFVGDDPVIVDFDWSDSYTTYPGASVTGWSSTGERTSGAWNSALENPPPQTYLSTDISGLAGYRVTLELSTDQNDAPAAFRRGVRYVFTLRRPGDRRAGDPVNAEPIVNFEVSGIQGSFDRGRWSTQIRVYGSDASENVFLPGALVILFAEDSYAGDTSYIGPSENGSVGPIRDRENVVMVGHIADDSIREDDETGDVTFDVVSLAELAQDAPLYPIPIENDDAATEWYGCPDLTIARAIWHYLCWHSTLPLIADLYLFDSDMDSTPEVTAEDFTAGNIYQHVDSFADERRYGRFLIDRYERAAVQIDQQMNAPKTAPTLLSLEDSDRLREIRIREVEPVSSLVEDGGIVYNAGLQIPYLSNAPGFVSGYQGGQESKTHLAITSQADLNTICGRHYAARNNRYPEWVIPMAGNWRVGDIWPQEYVRIESLTTQRKTFSDLWLILRDISYTYDANAGYMMTEYICERETDGPDGVTVEIPEELPPYSAPAIPRRRPQTPPVPGFGGGGTEDLGRRMLSTKDGIAVTDEIGANPPTWYLIPSPVTGAYCWDMWRDPWHWWTTTDEKKLWAVFDDGTGNHYAEFLYYMDDFPYGSWTLSYSGAGARPYVCDLVGSIEIEDTLFMIRYAKTWGGTGGNVYVMRTQDGGGSWAQLADLGERGGQPGWPTLKHALAIDQHSGAQTQHMAGNDEHGTKYGARTFNTWAAFVLDTDYPVGVKEFGVPYINAGWDGSYLICRYTGGGIATSTDTGNTWPLITPGGVTAYAISSFDGAVGYITGIFTDNTIKYTTDNGVVWTTWATLPAGSWSPAMLTEYGQDGLPVSVLAHFFTDNEVYLITQSGYTDKTGNIRAISPNLDYVTKIERDTLGSA